MDHTVYERKNTDLGSTSMTKSGGFSIKKGHRKLGALIGLAALAVPFAANLGTLGDAIHAVTGPQNVYESELLNVKLKTSQDKTKTTWDLEFDRSDMSVSEQTVKFKLDLEKAGLKDAEIKQDDKTLDMREGIVDAVLKSQSTHLILTAISTNEDKHDITLPVTELGLYDEKNGENKLPVDNRSVDLMMAFEKVAKEEVREESGSEVATKDDNVSQEKSVKVAPITGDDGIGFLPETATDPAVQLNTALANNVISGDEVQSVQISRDVRTTPKDDGTTNTNNFQIWSSKAYQLHNVVTDGHDETGIDITQKLNAPAAKIDGQYSTSDLNNDGMMRVLRGEYHNQFETVSGSNNNQSAYNITFYNDAALNNANFTVVYDRVGSYIDANGKKHDMGATMSISNIKTVSKSNPDREQMGDLRFIDIPNNLYSGLVYHGIDSLDITIQFYALNNGEFTDLIDIDSSKQAQMTFASLNNFGTSNNTFAFNTTTKNINNATYAESVAQIIGGQQTWNATTAKSDDGTSDTAMTQDSAGKWYSKANGDYNAAKNSSQYINDAPNWADALGASTFQRGALSYNITGRSYTFRLFTGSGNTWQTITCASLNPLQLDAPRKTVTDNVFPSVQDKSAASYNYAVGELKTANTSAQTVIDQARNDFGPYNSTYPSYNAYVAARENYVNEKISENKQLLYGDMFNKNLAIKNATNINDVIYFNYDYWIFQPTYQIGTDSIAKPEALVMTNVLDEDVTLRNGAKTDVTVFDTDGRTLTLGVDYDVDIGTENGRQKVVVTFTAKGLADVDFDGDNIAWDLDVHVPATKVLATGEQMTWKNKATVKAGVNKASITTNEVPVFLVPLEPNDLVINKVDDLENKISGAEFTLVQTADLDNWVNKRPTFKPVSPAEPIAGTSESGGARWVFNDLQVGEYTLTETTNPGGYTIATKTIDLIVTGELQDDNVTIKYEMEGKTPADQAALDNLSETATGQWSANVKNPRVPVQFKLNKVDGDGKALAGATFEYALKSDADAYEADPENEKDPWVKMTEGEGGVHTIGADVKLEFNKTYVVRETSPSGYVMQDNFYFIVVPKNTYNDPSFNYQDGTSILDNLNDTKADRNAEVNFLQVYESGNYMKWLVVKQEGSDPVTWVGDFVVANYAKSIFPRVGGTGIQAYIGAGLIVMLIAGGAAWYIKRRQNQ